jgi:hypothetical protein
MFLQLPRLIQIATPRPRLSGSESNGSKQEGKLCRSCYFIDSIASTVCVPSIEKQIAGDHQGIGAKPRR